MLTPCPHIPIYLPGMFILSTAFAQQESHLFGATIIQLIVSAELVVYQFCKSLCVLHVAVSSDEIKEQISHCPGLRHW